MAGLEVEQIVIKLMVGQEVVVSPELGSSSWRGKSGTLELSPDLQVKHACRQLIEALENQCSSVR